MVSFFLWCILLILCWPLALLALVLYPIVWLFLLPFRIVGIAVHGVLELVSAIIMLPARVLRGPRAIWGAVLDDFIPNRRTQSHRDCGIFGRSRDFHVGRKFLRTEFIGAAWGGAKRRRVARWIGALQHDGRSGPADCCAARILRQQIKLYSRLQN